MNPHKTSVLSASIFTSLFAAAAYADSNIEIVTKSAPGTYQVNDDVRVTLGAGLINTTRYIGSNERRYRVMPTLNATWKNGWFAGFPRGAGYNFSADPHLEYGMRLTADMGRRQNASVALNGLGDIGARAELGGFFNFSLGQQVKVSTGVRYGAGRDSKGMLLDAGVHYRLPLDDKQSLMFGINTTYANSNYMQSFFGVDATQSAASGYAQYTPGAGLREVDLTASYTYKIDRQWAIVAGATLGQLGSAVKAAPMTRSNAHDSVYVQAGYTF